MLLSAEQRAANFTRDMIDGIRTETIKIDHCVPMPKARRVAQRYPFRIMKIGDSFEVCRGSSSSRSPLYKSAKDAGVKICIRSDGNFIRVWRTA